jgi:PAS domain S-box-containing protein
MLHISLLTSIRPEWTSMSIITATCLILSAMELALLYKNASLVRRFFVLQIPGILDILVGSLTIALYVAAMTGGVESFIRRAGFLSFFWNPETRLALLTAIDFLVIGCALVFINNGSSRASNLAHTLTLSAATVSYLVLVGYFFGVQNIYAWLNIPMAFNTGVSLCAFSVAILCARPETRIMRVFTEDHAGSIIGRRLLPGVLLTPFVIGCFRFYGERSGVLASDGGLAIVAVAYTCCLLCLVWLTASSLDRLDSGRRMSESALRESEAKYRTLFENMTEEVHFWELVRDEAGDIKTWRLVDVNPPTLETWGRNTVEEVRGKTTDEIFGPGATDHYMPVVRKIMTEGVPYSFEDYFANLDKHFRFTSVPLRDHFITTGADITGIKKYERALRESEERLRLFIEHAPASLAMFDRQMRYLGVSLRWLQDYNLGERDIIGLSHYEVFPEISENWREVHRRGLAGEVVRADNDRFERADGSVQWLRWEVRPWRDAENEVAGIVIFSEDISERKAVEKALQESEERLRLLGDNLPESALYEYVHETDGRVRFLYVSAGIEELNGVKVTDVLNDAGVLHRQISPEYYELLVEAEERSAREMSDFDVEVPMRLPDGQVRWMRLHSRPRRTPDGRTIWDGVQIDVTERKRAEEAVRESQARLQAALASMTDAVFISDVEGRFVEFNDAFATFHRFKNKEECLKILSEYPDILDVFTPDGRLAPLDMWAVPRALRGETVTNAEYSLRRKDTGDTWVGSYSFGPIRDKDGAIVGSVVAGRDITEHKRLEEELRENQSRLDLALRSAEMGVWHLDIAENKRVFDDQVCRLLGIDASRFTGAAEEFFGAVHPEDRERVRAALAQTIEHGAPYETEYRAVWPDGTIRHIAARGRLLCDDKGRAIRLNGLIWDVTDRKKTEQELWESLEKNQFLADLIKSSSQPLGVGYLDGRLGLVNTAFEELTGYSGDELRSIDWAATLTPPEWQPVERLKLEELHRTGRPVRYQKEYIRKDGRRVPIELLVHLVNDSDGKPQYYYSYITDITERVRVEEELRKSRDELDLRVQERTDELAKATEELREKVEIIDFAHDAIIIRDPYGRTVFWNKGARETYGFSSDEALGQVTHDLLKAMFPIPLEEIVKTVLGRGEWKGEIKHTKANGERIVVDSRWAIQLGRNGEPAGFLEVNRDITARKIAEEEFRKVNRAFRTLSECNQAMVRQTDEFELLQQICRIVVDVGGYRMAWVGFAENDEDKSVIPVASAGYNEGYLDQAKITWADADRGRGPCGTSIRTGKTAISQNAGSNPAFVPWRFEAARRGYASSISLPLIVEKNVIGALGIFASEPDAFDEGEASLLGNLAENLSFGIWSIRVAEQRRRSEEELRIYASRLEVMNKELQDFAFVAAHDLQEPLRKIQTFCDMAMKRCSTTIDSAAQEYLDRVVNSAGRMRDLLRDLLHFSRIAANPESFRKIDLVKIARDAADVFEISVKETGGRIEIQNLPAVEADESQMLQLFQNLIGNALKFRSVRTPHIRVYGKCNKKGMCEIFVEDNGIGFEQEFAERIFKPFQRLHGRGEYEGTGMGLAICRKIVERHGGAITVESEEGKGSTFIIRMPAIQARLQNIVTG